jgi:lipopolysaccharide export system protein LptA
MNRTVGYCLLVLIPVLLGFTQAYAQQIQILNSDELRYDGKLKAKIGRGNIRVIHDGVYIQCDSAIISDNNTMDGIGNVYIYQPDTFDLRGKRVFYNGNTKQARVSGDIVLSDKQMVLTTPFIDYDTENKTGSYSAGGQILSGEDKLTSRLGFYDSRNQMAYFKQQVKLVNPGYTMESDTLQYHTASQTAYFKGPTVIQSDNNRITCVKGYYNTKSNLASFTNRATLFGETSVISADSFFYNRNSGLGKAFGHIVLHDTTEDIRVYGQQGWYNEKQKIAHIYTEPMAEKLMDKDTMLLLADTFFYYGDTLNKRLEAYPAAQIFSEDMQGVCDTLLYLVQDSMMRLIHDPILWNEKNQITGDTITLFLKNKKMDHMKVRYNGFIASELPEGRFDQISGKEIDHYFVDNKLRMVDVLGQAESIYYSRESDTGAFIGANTISCGQMRVFLDSVGIKDIRFYKSPSPDGMLYPPHEIPVDQQKLPNLNWQITRKPKKDYFLNRKTISSYE